jgi:hypothetical protein
VLLAEIRRESLAAAQAMGYPVNPHLPFLDVPPPADSAA